MLRKIKERVFEPSTYAGLAAAIMGLGGIFKVKEAPEVAQAVQTVGEGVAAQPGWTGLLMGLAGVAAMFLPERGRRE